MPFSAGSLGIPVSDSSQVGEARRAASSWAESIGFNEAARGNVAIIATEAATNLVRHAGGGEIVLRYLLDATGLEILALDKGPGMSDPARCMEDGYSTAGGPGNGLGAISRLSQRFEVYSQPGQGTVVLTQVWQGARPASAPFLEVGAVNLPIRGETYCGDAFAVRRASERALFMVADGLGHGPLAAEGSQEAVRVFHEETDSPFNLTGFLTRAHGALRKTRGAAVAVAEVDRAAGKVRYAGSGNIAGSVVQPDAHRHMISHNGTVGATMRKVQEFQYPWERGNILVMCSDGLGTSWQLDRYPGLSMRHPSIIAGVLYRDFRRIRDDVTVVVAKEIG